MTNVYGVEMPMMTNVPIICTKPRKKIVELLAFIIMRHRNCTRQNKFRVRQRAYTKGEGLCTIACRGEGKSALSVPRVTTKHRSGGEGVRVVTGKVSVNVADVFADSVDDSTEWCCVKE